MTLSADALAVLERTSRTFYIPISALPDRLREAVASGYLCMRAIDEIEDHPTLDPQIKARELVAISDLFQAQTTVEDFAHDEFAAIFAGHTDEQPEVTTRIGEWACLAPDFIAPRIWEATAGMASRMARWVTDDWRIETEADLDRYTYAVAGAVGCWSATSAPGTTARRCTARTRCTLGAGYNPSISCATARWTWRVVWTSIHRVGRTRIWTATRGAICARRTSTRGRCHRGTFGYFIQIPLALATATLDTMAQGEEKLSREAVQELVARLSQP